MSEITGWRSWAHIRKTEQWTVSLPKGGNLPWAMFYPADYSIASANLGYQYIFRLLKENGVAAERFCASPIPYRSVDNDTLLERFGIISASIAYELGVEEFCKWLRTANIPLTPSERQKSDHPLIIVGGAISYINPMLVSAIADAVVLGDGMDTMPKLIKAATAYSADRNREKFWAEAAKNDDLFVPPIEIVNGKMIAKKKTGKNQPLDGNYPLHSSWITEKSSFGKTLLLELQRGCIRNCNFCTLPNCFGKSRRREVQLLENAMLKLSKFCDFDQIGLVTPEAGDYPELDRLLEAAEKMNKSVSFASLRIDRLNEKMLSALSRGGRHAITVAPETGSDKLRALCGKKFENSLIIEKLKLAAKLGIDKVKLYFMLGLPTETDDDIKAIAELCSQIIEATGQGLVVSAGVFVPKPHTKWQKEQFIGMSEIKRRYKLLTEEIRKIKRKPPQLRLTSPKEAEAEFALAWAGYAESVQLCSDIQKYGKRRFSFSDRDRTLAELNCFA